MGTSEISNNIDHCRRLRAWVKLGLLEFWRYALPEESFTLALLEPAIAKDWPHSLGQTWEDNNREFCSLSEESELPIFGYCRANSLRQADCFLLALLGELQSEHSINLVIHELQAPDKSPHLSVHLACALLERLFPNDDSQGQTSVHYSNPLLEKPFVVDALVSATGDAPLPLCKLKMSPSVWALLTQNPRHDVGFWPGCKLLDAQDVGHLSHLSRQEAKTLAALLEDEDAAIIIRGYPHSGRQAFAYELAKGLGLQAVEIPLHLWEQELALTVLCRYAKCLPVLKLELQNKSGSDKSFALDASTQRNSKGKIALIVGSDTVVETVKGIDVNMMCPHSDERYNAWSKGLGDEALSWQMAQGALLSINSIDTLARQATHLAKRQESNLELRHIQEARAYQGSEKLRQLAERVNRNVTRDAMVFGENVQQGLELLLLRARGREAIWSTLGSTLTTTPSKGVRALFSGDSGTGKTLAASYIATQLASPLYRVDLSAVMNKYIGESEKNLSQLLDYAAAFDVTLLFDEADSLFGARSDGKENGERFANMLTNFLLTRIENHPGVVILTTNGKDRIDKAFNRRIDVEVNFPMPAFDERLALWHAHLGKDHLPEIVLANIASYCNFAGGQIRNAVLAAATYAGRNPIQLSDIMKGVRLEYAKLGRKLPTALERMARAKENGVRDVKTEANSDVQKSEEARHAG